ncbi:hypothetical protein Tco_0026220 [Tanacetum coccineum]
METQKPLLKDEDREEVDVHMYRSMIGSLMYLISSRPDIMYLKGQPKLGLWYLKDSPFDLVAYTDSDYAEASLDKKSTIGGYQFLRCRLISWQCKKQTVVANSITEAEYVAASSTEYAFSAFSSLMDTRMSSELYPKDSPFDLVAYTDSDYAGASLDRKSTTGGCQFLGCRLISGNARNIQWLQIPQQKLNGKKIIISEASVRRDLKLEDEEGIDCLPNSTIFEQLALMGYEKISQKLTFYKPFFSPQWKFLIHTILQCLSPKTTAWNEFSSTMASAIICLATNQKFNFSKFIFEGMIRNLDNVSGKFLMYPSNYGVLGED